MIEVELRVKVDDLNALEEKVKRLGGKYGYAMTNVDDYYLFAEDAARLKESCMPKKGVVRIRRLKREGGGEKVFLTIKTTEGSDFAVRKELQVKVSSASETARIIEHFECKKIVSLSKHRKIYNAEGIGVLLDDVKQLGNWAEVSIEGANVNVEKARQRLFALLEKLGYDKSKVETKGYFNLAIEQMQKKATDK